MSPNKRYRDAVAANIDHLQRAQMAWICIQGFEAAGTPNHLFAKLCFNALFNDYVSKCAKVFETGRQAASLWYIERTDARIFLAELDGDAKSIEEMRDIAFRLKHLRDRELMHIDKDGVLDRAQVWRSAEIDPKKLQLILKDALRVLRRIAEHYEIPVAIVPRELNGPRARRIAQYIYSYPI